MGRLGKVLSFVRTTLNGAPVGDVKADTGGGANVTGKHLAPPGDDSQPLAADYVALVPDVGAGRYFAVGYTDGNQAVAGPGEKRIYARNPTTGNPVAAVWLKSDGTIIASNASGSFELQPGGDVVINGVTIDTSGNITTSGDIAAAELAAPSILANGLELAGHTHLAGTPPGTTGPNLP